MSTQRGRTGSAGTRTMTTTEVVERYYRFANAGDWDPWCDLFATDATLDEKVAGHFEGREALREAMRGFPSTYASFANRPIHIVVNDGQAAVMSHISGRTTSGGSVETDVANFFEVRNGEITRLQIIVDTADFTAITGK